MEILALIALTLAAIPAAMFLWNLPQLRPPTRPQPTLGSRRREEAEHLTNQVIPPPHVGGYNSGVQCENLGCGSSRPTSKDQTDPAPQPSSALSVLIPARNEAANIRGALTSVLANQDANFEVVVLDDHSTDETADIVRTFAAADARVRIETAPPLPPGWCGKQHACHILSQHARHPLLVFMDADVRLAPQALTAFASLFSRNNLLSHMQQKVALASGVPRQLTGTLLEKMLIPLIHFVLLGFLPIWRMRRTTAPAYGAGCGQLFIARAEAYRAVGGHAAIRDSLHDGLKLPRAFRRAGFRTDLFDATNLATCRMYASGAEVLAGLTKNAHEGLAAPAQIGPWTFLLFGGQVLPWLLLAFSPWLNPAAFQWAIFAALLSILPRLLAAGRFQQSWLGAALHPVGVLLFLAIQWRAFARSFRKLPQSWKGRSYGGHAPMMDATLPSTTENAMADK